MIDFAWMSQIVDTNGIIDTPEDLGFGCLDLHPTLLILISKALPVWMSFNPFLSANHRRRFFIKLAKSVVQLYILSIYHHSESESPRSTHFESPGDERAAEKSEKSPLSIEPVRAEWEYLKQ